MTRWLSLLLLVGACSRGEPSGETPTTEPAAPNEAKNQPGSPRAQRAIQISKAGGGAERISVVRAELRNPEHETYLSGQVVAPPGGAAEVAAPVPARIRAILVSEGQQVRLGQALAELEAPEVARVAGQLAEARARRERAEVIVRQEEQLGSQSATSQRAIAEAHSELAAAQALESASKSLLSAYGTRGGRVQLVAPIAGTVVRANLVVGAQVEPQSVLFRIVDLPSLLVRADVPEAKLDHVPAGVAVQVQGLQGMTRCRGQVEALAQTVDPIRRTMAARVRPVRDESCELIEGAFVDVVVAHPAQGTETEGGSVQRVSVPRSALTELDGVPVVFVPDEAPGSYRARAVRLDRTTPTTAYLASGLAAGENVVARGVILLKGEWMRARLED